MAGYRGIHHGGRVRGSKVGTANFAAPRAMLDIIDGLQDFMQKKGVDSIAQLCGVALS